MLPVSVVRLSRFAGYSAIDGSTVVAGTPDAPVSRRVQVLQSTREPVLVADTWSASDGSYRIDGIAYRPPGDGYTVIAYDHTGVHDPVAKGNLVPTPMPPDPAEHV